MSVASVWFMAAPSPSAHTAVKVIGGIAWIAGLALLVAFPPLGFLILLGAIVLSILSLTWTRQARHDELVAAAGGGSAPGRAPNRSVVQTRYDQLHVEHPDWNHNQLWRQAESDVAGAWSPDEASKPLEKSTADRLGELDQLRAAEAISEDEYAAQRAQILGDI